MVNIANLRQEYESAELHRQSLLKVLQCVQAEIAQASQKAQSSRARFDQIVLGAFNKNFPGFTKAIFALRSTASEYDRHCEMVSTMTDPDCGGDDSPGYVMCLLRDEVFSDNLLESIKRALDSLDKTLVCKSFHQTVGSLKKSMNRTEKSIDKARRSKFRSAKAAWNLATDIYQSLEKVALAAERAAQEVGYGIVASRPVTR
jgi:hypothetical protein